jgi:hypothetical protein
LFSVDVDAPPLTPLAFSSCLGHAGSPASPFAGPGPAAGGASAPLAHGDDNDGATPAGPSAAAAAAQSRPAAAAAFGNFGLEGMPSFSLGGLQAVFGADLSKLPLSLQNFPSVPVSDVYFASFSFLSTKMGASNRNMIYIYLRCHPSLMQFLCASFFQVNPV